MKERKKNKKERKKKPCGLYSMCLAPGVQGWASHDPNPCSGLGTSIPTSQSWPPLLKQSHLNPTFGCLLN